ncbi:MAG TPA: PqiC family protein [Candidatus Binatia bacterium]
MFSWKGLPLTLWLLCLIPAGCASLGPKPDPSRFFALASLPRTGQKAQVDAGTNVLALGIGPIKFPGYLDRQQLVTRISQNRFAVAENDRWAEPLEENFSRVLSQNLSILLHTDRVVTYPWERSQSPTYQVQVEVLRFEPNAQQMVELWARWSITDNTKKTVSARESFLSRPAKDKSTEASVAALSEVVGSLSQEISASIRGLIGG